MKPTVTAGLAVLAGVALFEAALIPGVVIGGAAVLAPKLLLGLRRRLKPLFGSTVHRPPKPAAPSPVAGTSRRRRPLLAGSRSSGQSPRPSPSGSSLRKLLPAPA
jgi:hypothetical protein